MTLLDERERVAITFTLSMDYIPVEQNIEMGQLRVDVLDATYPGVYINRHVYCKFYLNEQMVFMTQAVEKSLQIAWNEFFEVEVRSRIDAKLRVMSYEFDPILGTQKAVYNAVIHLQRLEPCRPQDFTIQMAEAGRSIRLQLLFRPEWITRAVAIIQARSHAGRNFWNPENILRTLNQLRSSHASH
jgi:Ca2+-dependent lipid-binding protein